MVEMECLLGDGLQVLVGTFITSWPSAVLVTLHSGEEGINFRLVSSLVKVCENGDLARCNDRSFN